MSSPIWRQSPSLAHLNGMLAGSMCEHIGIEFTEVGDNYLIARMPVDARTLQPAGLLHGGASVALAETVGSVASAFCIDAKSKMPVGLEINANHLRSARSGFVYGKGTPIKIGQSVHVWSIEIHSDKGELISICRLTCMIIDRKA